MDGTPLPRPDLDAFAVDLASAVGTPLPKRNPANQDVRAYLKDYVATLDPDVQSFILSSAEWKMIMDDSVSPMTFCSPNYDPIPFGSQQVVLSDQTRGICASKKNAQVAMYINPNFPDDQILLAAFHESVHVWRKTTFKGVSRNKLTIGPNSFASFDDFWSINKNAMMEDETWAQLGTAHFYRRLQINKMAMSPIEMDIINLMEQKGVAQLRVERVQDFLLNESNYAAKIQAKAEDLYERIRNYCLDDSNWTSLSAPTTPAARFAAFNGANWNYPLPLYPAP